MREMQSQLGEDKTYVPKGARFSPWQQKPCSLPQIMAWCIRNFNTNLCSLQSSASHSLQGMFSDSRHLSTTFFHLVFTSRCTVQTPHDCTMAKISTNTTQSPLTYTVMFSIATEYAHRAHTPIMQKYTLLMPSIKLLRVMMYHSSDTMP